MRSNVNPAPNQNLDAISDDAKLRAAMAQGRLAGEGPLAVIDIGSNSVRLVVYERLSRSPSVLFNEKVLCGLGKAVAETGRMDDEAVARAIAAIGRFQFLCTQMRVRRLEVLATAAAREAENGPQFLSAVEAIINQPVDVLSGKQEAHRSALGVISGFHSPNGIMGDLGGGSLEFVDVEGSHIGSGITLPLGTLRLQADAQGNLKRAEQIAEERIAQAKLLSLGKNRTFYSVGGTWRALAKLHMEHDGYPLRVMHDYRIPAKELRKFCKQVIATDPESLAGISGVSKARRPLVPYGAIVMEKTLEHSNVEDVAISAIGVREGHLYQLLSVNERERDPLFAAAEELAILRSRSPAHAFELIEWTERIFDVLGIDETAEEVRLRKAACLLSDIGWRAHPDYRGEQSLNIVAHAGFLGINHAGRAYLALSNYFRHSGTGDNELSPKLQNLAGDRIEFRARIVAVSIRLAMLISAAMPGVVDRVSIHREENKLVLKLPADLKILKGERLINRLRQLAKLTDLDYELVAEAEHPVR